MPSISKLTEIVELSRAILFPGYFGDAGVNHLNLPYHIGINIEHLSELLIKQIEAVLNLTNENNSTENKQKAKEITFHFLNEFPLLREILATDVIAAYNAFKNKGFGIVGVSLDNKEEAWKDAIKSWGMTWPMMSDLKGWECAGAAIYGVRSIPATVLVDQEGTIIARNLRGEAIKEKLAELLK